MSFSGKELGKKGEQIAALYLQQKGYSIKDLNFSTRYGELDIVAQKGEVVIFVEVKTRVGIKMGMPYEAVTPRKVQHLRKAIDSYLLKKHLEKYKLSLDVISIIFDSTVTEYKIKHIESIIT